MPLCMFEFLGSVEGEEGTEDVFAFMLPRKDCKFDKPFSEGFEDFCLFFENEALINDEDILRI